MRWKTTVVLLVITIGIGAYLSLYEIRQPSPEEQAQRSKHLLDIASDTVTQLVLDLPKAKVTLTRQGSEWRMNPGNFRADDGILNRILSELAPLSAERTLNSREHPLDVKAFGLDPAVGWLTVVSHETPTTILIGESTPVQGNRYVKISGRPNIAIVSSSLFDTANQPLEAFRDHRMIRFDAWSVDGLTVNASTRSFSLTRTDNVWHLTQPRQDRADRSEINALLNRLTKLPIKRFVTETPPVEQLSTWGFDHPTAEMTLRTRQAPPVSLFFGTPLPDDSALLYAKRSDEAALYAVAKKDVEALLQSPENFRARACFEFFTSSVTKVEVARGASRWMIERPSTPSSTSLRTVPSEVEGRNDTQWREATSHTTLDTAQVEQFLNKLADVRVKGFIEDRLANFTRYGVALPSSGHTGQPQGEPDNAVGSIAVWTPDQKEPQRLFIGAPIEGSTNYYGRSEGRDLILKLPSVVTALVNTTLEQLRSPSATSNPQGATLTSPAAPSPKTSSSAPPRQ